MSNVNADWASGFDAARARAVSVLDESLRAMLRDSTAPFDSRVVETFKSARERLKALSAEDVAADDPEARVRQQLLDGLAERIGRAIATVYVDPGAYSDNILFIFDAETIACAMKYVAAWSGPRPALPPEVDPVDIDSDDEYRFVRGARVWLDETMTTEQLRATRERVLAWQREHASTQAKRLTRRARVP